jgi:uncharacterized protein YqgC (DUF456 family)
MAEEVVKTTEPVGAPEKEDGWYPGKGVEAVGGAVRDNPGGAVGGAIIGTFIVPGLGTVIGAGVGAWWSKKRKERNERLAAIRAGTIKPE